MHIQHGMEQFVYLDHCATTPLDPAVLEAMMPFLTNHFGNASSLTHTWGRTASAAVERARDLVAQTLNAQSPEEILFTSGATEAINFALKGVFYRYQSKGKHFITSRAEHKAVLRSFAYLERLGAEVTYLDVDSSGQPHLDQLQKSFRRDTVLLALMSANNETGVLHPVDQYAQLAREHNALYFCDATQSIGKVPFDLQQIPADLVCLSGHKFYGPKGIGALYIRKKNKRTQIEPLLHGGNQEQKLRGGTLNVPGIVGLGKAMELAYETMSDESAQLKSLRDDLENTLLQLPEVYRNGSLTSRLPHVCNLCIRHVPSGLLMGRLPSIGISSGSACVSGEREVSHVLKSMGLSAEDAQCSIRISLGRFNSRKDLQVAAEKIKNCILRLRSESPTWLLHEKGLLD